MEQNIRKGYKSNCINVNIPSPSRRSLLPFILDRAHAYGNSSVFPGTLNHRHHRALFVLLLKMLPRLRLFEPPLPLHPYRPYIPRPPLLTLPSPDIASILTENEAGAILHGSYPPKYTYTQIFCGRCGTYITDHGVFTPSLRPSTPPPEDKSCLNNKLKGSTVSPTGEPPVREPVHPRCPNHPVFKPTAPDLPCRSCSSSPSSSASSVPSPPLPRPGTSPQAPIDPATEGEDPRGPHPGTFLWQTYPSVFFAPGAVPRSETLPPTTLGGKNTPKKHGFEKTSYADVERDSENPVVFLAGRFCAHGRGADGDGEAKDEKARDEEEEEPGEDEERGVAVEKKEHGVGRGLSERINEESLPRDTANEIDARGEGNREQEEGEEDWVQVSA